MISLAEERAIAVTIRKQRNRLGKDVKEMCELVLFLRELCGGKLNIYQQRFDDCCSAIYRTLKLHLTFHCVDASVLAHENLMKLGRFYGSKEMEKFSVEKRAADPGSKVLEIVRLIVGCPETQQLVDGNLSKTDRVFKTAEKFLNMLSTKNIFRPKVLAKVWRNDRGFVGSSIAVSPFLRPLCLNERISNFKLRLRKAVVFAEALPRPSNDQATDSCWSSTAYGPPSVEKTDGDKYIVRYIKEKAPCGKCQETFQELTGFISGISRQSKRDESFLGACAEYCPVNELIPDDDVGRDTQLEMRSKLESHLQQCSPLFAGIRKLCELANKHDLEIKGDDKKLQLLREAARQEVDTLNIFGFRPQCKM